MQGAVRQRANPTISDPVPTKPASQQINVYDLMFLGLNAFWLMSTRLSRGGSFYRSSRFSLAHLAFLHDERKGVGRVVGKQARDIDF